MSCKTKQVLGIMLMVGFCSAAARADVSVLYAPAAPDNAAFRAALETLVGGPVDYFDARMYTPDLSTLLEYDCVITHWYYYWAAPATMGDRLADFVDAGHRVILGDSCYGRLQGRIMTVAYCPAIIGGGGGEYNGDGTDCVHEGVTSYSSYEAVDELQPGAHSDGTVGSEGKSAVAWRGDRLVYYSCGNTGGGFDPGDWARLTANMCLCPVEPYGACCDPDTAVCVDDLSQSQCEADFHADETCAALDPPCGTAVSLLYAPANPDNPEFRAEVATLIGGPVDYFNAYTSPTPTLDFLLQYDCVFTWVNYPYYDGYAFGDLLADYVDAGGRVILGQWTLGSFGYSQEIPSRIELPEYCPVAYISTHFGSGAYAGDGSDCVHLGVGPYATDYLDVISTLSPGALSDGTFEPYGSPAVAWRADRRVYYSPGNLGGEPDYTSGDWARLTANMCTCQVPHIVGDLNCDGVINGYDIDPFVLALTSPEESYAPQFPYCDYMLADCNGDGEVNGYDIDPFVDLLVSP
jgi:hypothetical protein